MLNFAHAGHEHTEQVTQAADTAQAMSSQIDTLHYGAYFVITLGLCLLFVGTILAASSLQKKKSSQK